MNTITIELSTKDRETLSKILAALEGVKTCQQCSQISNAYAQELKQIHSEPKAEEHPVTEPFPAEETKDEAHKDGEEQQKKPIKKEDVQKKVVELSAAGHKGKVKTIVTAYAECVSDIPEGKLAEVYDKLIKLV